MNELETQMAASLFFWSQFGGDRATKPLTTRVTEVHGGTLFRSCFAASIGAEKFLGHPEEETALDLSEVPAQVRDSQYVALVRALSDHRPLQGQGSHYTEAVSGIQDAGANLRSGDCLRAENADRIPDAGA